MFSRKSCYFFVRPKKNFLEVVVFLGRALKAPQVKRADRRFEVEGRQLHPHHPPRRSGAADHGLAAGSVRVDREENDHEESHDENHEKNREEAGKEIEAALARPTELYCAPLEVTKSMAKLSRRELARMASGMAAALLCAASSARSCAQYVYRAADRNDEGPRGSSIRSRRVHTRPLRGRPAPASIWCALAPRSRGVAEDAAVEADRAGRRLPSRASAASPHHARDAHISRLPARESRVRQPPRRQRARVPPVPEKARHAGRRHDLRARPRPRRGRHRRHRRQGRDRTDKAGYQHDFAIQVAEAGMAAVAIEPMGFGCRRDPINARKGLSRKRAIPSAGGALLVGQTMLGWRVWDVMRTLDYIATRPELDASRVGCMGISGGGTVTVFATALEPRLRVALVSGYLNTFRDSIGSLVALHRQLRAGHSELGRDARRRGPHRAAAVVRRIRREGQHLPDSRRASRASTRCGRSTASSAPRIGSSRRSFPTSIRSGAGAASRSWRVT